MQPMSCEHRSRIARERSVVTDCRAAGVAGLGLARAVGAGVSEPGPESRRVAGGTSAPATACEDRGGWGGGPSRSARSVYWPYFSFSMARIATASLGRPAWNAASARWSCSITKARRSRILRLQLARPACRASRYHFRSSGSSGLSSLGHLSPVARAASSSLPSAAALAARRVEDDVLAFGVGVGLGERAS